MKIGIIGLGIIGSRVAEIYRRAGHDLCVWSRTPRPIGGFVSSPEKVASECDLIQIFVNDGSSLMAVLREMGSALSVRHLIINSSTISHSNTLDAAKWVHGRGAAFLDCPFTGSRDAAAAGQLVYYVGGSDGDLERARSVLEMSAKEILPLGRIGDATVLKLATNLVSAVTVEALAEALALTASMGIPMEKFLTATEHNGNCSGLARMKIPTMIRQDFTPHFSLKNMLKDSKFALEMAHEHSLSLPALAAVSQCMQDQTEHGHGESDYGALMKAFVDPTE